MKKILYILFITISLFINTVFSGEISRTQFTSQIIDREPVDKLISIPADMQKVYYFSELLNFKDEQITHQWIYQDQEMYRLNFTVKGPRWRVWSSKRMLPKWNGSWTVNILNTKGQVLQSDSFVYFP